MPYSTTQLARAWIEAIIVIEQRNLIPCYMGKPDGAGGWDYDVDTNDPRKWVRVGGGESAAPMAAWNNLGAADDYTLAVWVTMSPEGKLIISDYRREGY